MTEDSAKSGRKTADAQADGPPATRRGVRKLEVKEVDPAERAIIIAAKQGDEDAFRQLVEMYQGPAYGWAFERLRRRQDAIDVAQEAFVRVFRNLDRFDEDKRFSTWLYRIVANLCIDCIRRRKSNRSISGLEELPPVACDRGSNWVKDEVRREVVEDVYRCLDRLPHKYREILVLREIEEIPAKEIAGLLGITHATVRWRLHQARKSFRDVWLRLVEGRDMLAEGITDGAADEDANEEAGS